MALVVTVAGENSDSYATLAEADDYFAIRGGAIVTAWDEAIDPAKENALKVAAQMMQCVRYHNRRYSDSVVDQDPQALEFPREHQVDSEGEPVIDIRVKYAQIQQAGALIAAQTTSVAGMDADTIAELRALGVDSVRIGTTSLSFGGVNPVRDPRKSELLELGFSTAAAAILAKFVSKIGSITRDAESIIRIGELRRIDVFQTLARGTFEVFV